MVKAATAVACFKGFAAFYQLIDGEAKTLLNNKLNKYIDILSRTSPEYRHVHKRCSSQMRMTEQTRFALTPWHSMCIAVYWRCRAESPWVGSVRPRPAQ